jgi:glycerophosphoryl diester phosphodiesterase
MRTAKRGVELIGHRGAPREFPENSLPAFERAIERGADAIELDVHVTSDGVPIVHHDPDVGRHGLAKRPVAAMMWQEVSRIQLAPEIFVPSLAQVLMLVGSRATVYVELKGKDVAAQTIAVIRASGSHCAVHSFDHAAIARVARIAPEVRRGILFDEYPKDIEGSMREASALDVWPQWELTDRGLVDRVHREGGRVIAWTVNRRAAAKRLIALGVDALCGDDVRLLPK